MYSLKLSKESIIIQEIYSIDRKEEDITMYISNNNRSRLSLKNELSQISLKEAQFWSQREQKLWIKDGDENTSFFHRICTAKQKRNSNFEIVDDDGILHNSNVTIANTFINYFSTLFKGEKIKRIFMENLDWHPIPSSESSNLCAPFQEDEVKAMIQSFEGNKALVLDDLTFLSYSTKNIGNFSRLISWKSSKNSTIKELPTKIWTTHSLLWLPKRKTTPCLHA